MSFSVLASGSKANATIVKSGDRTLLIDCGLSMREVESRLRLIEVDPNSLVGILVTHEHSDHIRGIGPLSRRYKLPVYANEATAAALPPCFETRNFPTGSTIIIGDFIVSSFTVIHDARDPVGLKVTVASGYSLVHVTDLGRVTELVRQRVAEANGLVLEANHDRQMLTDCAYPWQLKQRIASSHGHLSNDEAGELLAARCHPGLINVVLGHLSEQSNTPGLARETVTKLVAQSPFRPAIWCASPVGPTPLLSLTPSTRVMQSPEGDFGAQVCYS